MSIKKNYNKLIGIEVFLTVILLFFAITGISNYWVDGFALVLYMLSMLSLFTSDTGQIIKLFSFILGSTWAIIAVFLLENATVKVMYDQSFHYGSFCTFVFAWLVFYLTILFSEKRNKKTDFKENQAYIEKFKNNKGKTNTVRILVFVAFIAELVAFLSICTKPYFLYGVDRIAYAKSALPSWLNGHIGFFAVIIPLAVLILDNDRFLSISYCVLYFLINLWIGEKFTGQILGVYFLILSYFAVFGYRTDPAKIRRIVYISACFAFAMLLVVYFQMKVVGGRDFGYYLSERISAQGYMWWITYARDHGNGMHLDELGDELVPFYTHLSGKMTEYNFGIYKLMKLYYPTNRWRSMLEYGFRGTESTLATFYYYMKIPGLIIGQMILGIFTTKLLNQCYRYLRRIDYVRIFFSFYILRNFIAIQSMSDFYLLVKPTMIMSYILLFVGGDLNFIIRVRLPQIKFGRIRNRKIIGVK